MNNSKDVDRLMGVYMFEIIPCYAQQVQLSWNLSVEIVIRDLRLIVLSKRNMV